MGLLRRLFGAKKTSSTTSSPPSKRRWSFARSSSPSSHSNKREGSVSNYEDSLDANKHAIAVAAATAAVAEAALAAAQAAAEVVRLTTVKGGSVQGANSAPRRWLEEFAAVKIQSAFRGYLKARRALRALKALVKLQALVRGHIVRKQTADMLRRMQTLVRVQARARATRSYSQVSDSWQSSSTSNYSRHVAPSSPHKDHLYRAYSTKYDGPSVLKRCGSNANFREMVDVDGAKFGSLWLERWMEESMRNNHGSKPPRNRHADDERNDKILEVDTWKPRMKSQQNSRAFNIPQHVLASDDASQSFMPFDSPSKLSTKGLNPAPSVPSGEALSFNSLKLSHAKEEAVYRTAENSPRALSVSSRPGSSSGRRAPFTPTRSECSWGFLNGYEGFPNYMSNTESSRAKVRSQSAPRQRLEFDKYGLSKRSLQGLYEGDTISERSFPHHNDYMHKAYPASGRLSRIGSSNLR